MYWDTMGSTTIGGTFIGSVPPPPPPPPVVKESGIVTRASGSGAPFTRSPWLAHRPYGRNVQLRRRFDGDAQDYFNRVAARGTDLSLETREQVSTFVRELKRMGVWDGLVDAWLLRAPQNVGTGSTVVGLKSMDGTLVNGPTWGADGMRSSGVASEVFVDANFNAGSFGVFTLFTCHAGLTGPAHGGFSANDTYTPWWSLSHNWYGQNQSGFGVLNASAAWVSAAVTNPPAYNHAGFQTNQFNFGASFVARHQGLPGQWPVQGGDMAATFNPTPNIDLHLGNYQGSGFKYAFAALFRADVPDLHAMYRETIGTGLGLP